jgi:DNA topoisomerase-3
MTALWEQTLDDIAQGKMPLDTFMQKQLQWTRHLVDKGRSDTVKITAPVIPPARFVRGRPASVRERMVISGDVFVIRSVAVLLQGKMAGRAGKPRGAKKRQQRRQRNSLHRNNGFGYTRAVSSAIVNPL